LLRKQGLKTKNRQSVVLKLTGLSDARLDLSKLQRAVRKGSGQNCKTHLISAVEIGAEITTMHAVEQRTSFLVFPMDDLERGGEKRGKGERTLGEARLKGRQSKLGKAGTLEKTNFM